MAVMAVIFGVTTYLIRASTGNYIFSILFSCFFITLLLNNAWWGYPINSKIISYGSSSAVVHFSKAVSGYSIAKWGSLELMKSYSWDPYNPGGGYGPPVKTYY
ncbi:DUF7689 domain-containing protein [Desulfitobacterium sp.]|uniref:DUF7689 domain-containing protein n=1 Tax=Desulfitobacterium sp. TaxID=49981 RepID=UPI002CBB07F0|nr:hypothetical protein [Desulfitobacterium sp.]HVJ50160.1 hypothetical protein [Desulfitobacterium sp.]